MKFRRLDQNDDGEQEQGNVQHDDFNLTFMSKCTYDGYQSAPAYVYCVSNTVMSVVMAKNYSN